MQVNNSFSGINRSVNTWQTACFPFVHWHFPSEQQLAQMTELPQVTQPAQMSELPQMTQPAQITKLPQMTQAAQMTELP